MAQTKLGRGRNRGKKLSREEGEIGSESREKGDLPPCSPLFPPLTPAMPETFGNATYNYRPFLDLCLRRTRAGKSRD